MTMKTFTSIAMAGVLAATTVVATATAASAGGGWGGPGGNHRHHHGGPQPHYQTYHHQEGDAGGALVAGAFLGLAFGLIASEALAPDPYPPQAYQPQYAPEYDDSEIYSEGPYEEEEQYAAVSAHADWCRAKYKTYNEESDTFVDFRGVVRRCVESN